MSLTLSSSSPKWLLPFFKSSGFALKCFWMNNQHSELLDSAYAPRASGPWPALQGRHHHQNCCRCGCREQQTRPKTSSSVDAP